MIELEFFEKTAFGKTLTYPTPNISKAFQALTGNKTASASQLKALKDLGFKIVMTKVIEVYKKET